MNTQVSEWKALLVTSPRCVNFCCFVSPGSRSKKGRRQQTCSLFESFEYEERERDEKRERGERERETESSSSASSASRNLSQVRLDPNDGCLNK